MVGKRAVAAQVSRLFKDASDLRSDFRIFMPNEHGQLFDDPEDEDIMPSKTRTPIDWGRSSSRKDVSGGTVPQKRK
jgi:paired amphipathic helix protein Sin3a